MQGVESDFRFLDVLGPNVHFAAGTFKDAGLDTGTPIAVLRIDGDTSSDVVAMNTLYALYTMYEDVPVGGIIILSTPEEGLAVWNTFKTDQGISENLNRIDDKSVWLRKTRAVKIDPSRMPDPILRDSMEALIRRPGHG